MIKKTSTSLFKIIVHKHAAFLCRLFFMKKIIIVPIFFFFLAFAPNITLAHPGGTESSGCHTCRTNCSSWGLYTGEYHCHQSKGTTQPYSPISSTYGSNGTGYTSPAPQYSYPSYSTPTIPDCPLMSSYDSISGSCKCYAGYVVSNTSFGTQSCVSGNSFCWNKYGYHSSYSSYDKSCSCDSGYEFDSSEQCVSSSEKCTNDSGSAARYNSLSKRCECSYGYVMVGGNCVVEEKTCPTNSYLDYNDKCSCNAGYEVNSDKSACIKKCGSNETRIGSQCLCKDGFVLNNGACISHTQNCMLSFGVHSYGTKNINGLPDTSSCYCDPGYEWNQGQTDCIKQIVKVDSSIENKVKKDIFKSGLKINSKGADVKRLQIRLGKEKVFNGKTDGVYGKITEKAVKDYQKKNKLKATGRVDEATRKKLNK